MNFSEFYNDAQRELTSTFISMFAKGRLDYADHLRWLFENEEKEKLIQKPVFQSIFPWKPYPKPMRELSDLLGDDFIDALNDAKFKEPLDDDAKEEDMSFSKDNYPYMHQVESWEAVLKEHKSILVTTGTGSGKTECFMVPVLKDLIDEKKKSNGNNPGVQAIFLYPLNALIASQRKRIHAWCEAISPKVTYAIYTGETKSEISQAKRVKSFPQIIDRNTIREDPPQILFTNPTMLEYMMVRSSDQSLVEHSKNLKWIILDEAHIYNGSTAAELAILLRRVLKLFGKNPSEVNFAITSATIGEGKEEEMIQFISNLTGKDAKEDFRFITGERIVPKLDENNSLNDINRKFGLSISIQDIINIREKLNEVPALSLDEICDFLGYNGSVDKCLDLIDALSVSGSAYVDGKESALLPVRAHFFGRSVNGIYACTNPECAQYKKNHISIGALTTIASQTCPHCKGKMLEVVRCGSCGEFLLQGEKITNQSIDADPTVSKYVMKDNTVHFQHLLNDDDDSDDDSDDDAVDEPVVNSSHQLLLSTSKNDVPFNGAVIYHHTLDSTNGIIKEGKGYTSCNDPNNNANELLCPECGDKGFKCRKIMFPSSLESRLLAHTFLKQSPANTKVNPNELVYEGKKYITFTDNRQKTANITQGANISVEREWMRAAILYNLLQKAHVEERNRDTLKKEIDNLEDQLENSANTLGPDLLGFFKATIAEKKAKLLAKPVSSWDNIKNNISGAQDLKRMQEQLGKKSIKTETYLQSMFIDQMGNKPLRGNSLETLGLVHLDYPAINNLGYNSVPSVFIKFFGYPNNQDALEDWKRFLRICIDYEVRRNSHLDIPDDDDLRQLVTQSYYSDPIYAPQMNRVTRENGYKCKRWPRIRNLQFKDPKIGRLPLLLLLGKGICNMDDLTEHIADCVNSILAEAWHFLTANILKDIQEDLTDNGLAYKGYKLNIFDSDKVKLSLIEHATVCPMTNQILDCTFRGISPMVKGHLDPRTLSKYKIKSPTISIPQMTIKSSDFNCNDGSFDYNGWRTAVEKWFDEKYVPAMRPLGGDLSAQRQIFLRRPIFITVEHSGQIESDKLRKSERLFERGKVNVLSCSTTMEMGVDIGGISAVLMNNVPPKPANYLQRTGRAGRRSETQSLALTICDDNPIGREVLNNPKWALDHDIESPSVTFSSVTIMQRHINSFLLGEYIRTKSGGAVTDQIGAFLYGTNYKKDQTINYTFDGFMDFLSNVKNDSSILDKVKVIINKTVYANKSFDLMVSQCKIQIETICGELKGTIDALAAEKNQTNSAKYQNRLEYRIKALWEQNLLSFLSENNFLPSNGIPTNIVELVAYRNRKSKEEPVVTQRQLSLAIQEYAPGREVIINNLVYPVIGIEKQGKLLSSQMQEKYISRCSSCGYVSIGYTEVRICPKCSAELRPIFTGQRRSYTLSVEPSGFLGGEYRRTKKPKLATDFTVPELLGMEPWEDDAADKTYRIRSSVHDDAQILYVNKGKGYGFAFCEYCGKMEPEDGLEDSNAPLPTLMQSHKDISKGDNCYGNTIAGSVKRNVLLSACYHTDISELDIKSSYDHSSIEYGSLLYTLGTVICNTFTQLLGIDSDEIWFGVTPMKTLFFYDTTSGGAGYASQLQIYIEKVLNQCYNKLSNCDCETACTNCLIDRRSQWFVEKLNKKLAIDWLLEEKNSRQDIPDDLAMILNTGTDNIRKITRDIASEISGRMRKRDFQSIAYFLSEGLMTDDLLSKVEFDLQMSMLVTAPVTMVVSYGDAHKKDLPLGIRMELNSFRNRYSALKALDSAPAGVIPIASFTYGSEIDVYLKYDTGIYLVKNPSNIVLKDYKLILTVEPTDVCFVNNFKDESVMSSSLLRTLLGDNNTKLANFLTDKNKSVHVKYTDIYVSNPISCIILGQILHQFSTEFNLDIQDVEVKTGRQFKTCYDPRRQYYLDTDFMMDAERNQYLEETLGDNIGDIPVSIDSNQRLPHARLLTLYNSEYEITINPDGGFAQGWRVFGETTRSVETNRLKAIKLTNILYRDNLSIRFTIGWCKK